jgi:hypothetical protein
MVRKLFSAAILATFGAAALTALPVSACGSLVAPNGAIRLSKATTLVAWHGGIEHYMTAFTYEGDVSKLGWIVPLPAVPIKIEEGGAWTLQRLFRETHPVFEDAFFLRSAAVAGPAQILQQVQVEALDITVLRGSGQAVVDWALKNGFSVDGDTSEHLIQYGKGSPIFMAAKFNLDRARARGQLQGDGAPVLITMKTAHPWVPLEVLALDGQQTQADIYMLTDQPLNTSNLGAVVGHPSVGTSVGKLGGLTVNFQEQLNPSLYRDLSTDRNMGWVWKNAWLTYLTLDAPAEQVTYDMSVTPTGVLTLAPFGTPPMAIVGHQAALPTAPLGTSTVVLVLLLGGGLLYAVARVARL